MPDCLFCSIIAGDVPADRVLESERTLAFRGINPQAPVLVRGIRKVPLPDLAAVAAAGAGLLDEMAAQAASVAAAGGVAAKGYRVIFNTGPEAGQTVFHAHAHVLGGRPMTWPPG